MTTMKTLLAVLLLSLCGMASAYGQEPSRDEGGNDRKLTSPIERRVGPLPSDRNLRRDQDPEPTRGREDKPWPKLEPELRNRKWERDDCEPEPDWNEKQWRKWDREFRGRKWERQAPEPDRDREQLIATIISADQGPKEGPGRPKEIGEPRTPSEPRPPKEVSEPRTPREPTDTGPRWDQKELENRDRENAQGGT